MDEPGITFTLNVPVFWACMTYLVAGILSGPFLMGFRRGFLWTMLIACGAGFIVLVLFGVFSG